MSKKKKKKTPRPAPRADRPVPRLTDAESRPSVAVTVSWMLSLLVTLAAEVIAIPATIISQVNPQPPAAGLSTHQVAELFLFLSLVSGMVCVGMVPLVYRVRAIPPPPVIVLAALVAGAVPPVTMVLRWLL
jgi:hypothetical protein